MINYQTNDIELEKFMDVKALRDLIQELHDSGDCGHMLSDILDMANKICSKSSEANFAWLASALEQYARGDVITVPAGTGTEEEFFAWLKDQSSDGGTTEAVAWGAVYVGGKYNGKLHIFYESEAQTDRYIAIYNGNNHSTTLRKVRLYTEPVPAVKPERITKQDAKQIANSVANSRCGSFWEWYKSYGRALLNKLNAERQVPVGVVPDCFMKLYHHARGMRAGTDWNKGIAARNNRQPLIDATRECDTWLAAPPLSRQGTDLMEEFAEKLAMHLAKKFPYGMSAGDVFAEVKTLLRGNKLCEDQ